ncbi:MAG: DNA-3-methyladenine glycosylase 2 family protein [Dehalococcoidia bacterium]|nr:DNA-3-methyladenine glycosylase 2 family protein [Dehalococcoidia bacterium]
MAEAMAHLRQADAVLAKVIESVGPYKLIRRHDPYASLLRTILFQQLAGAAAMAIQRRWLALYSDEERVTGPEVAPAPPDAPPAPPRPEALLATTDEQFRAAGVSRQKAGYMRDLALHVVDGRLNFAELPSLSDEEVAKRLVAVKGVGEWSAHMFLMFHLGRPDVLPVGDLGVRNGMRVAYGLAEMPTPAKAKEIGAPWAPFRSVGSWYMWRVTSAMTL